VNSQAREEAAAAAAAAAAGDGGVEGRESSGPRAAPFLPPPQPHSQYPQGDQAQQRGAGQPEAWWLTKDAKKPAVPVKKKQQQQQQQPQQVILFDKV